MAELDYAYLAEYVTLQANKLTAVGASFTFVAVPSLPIQIGIGVGGRVRARIDEGAVPIEVRAAALSGEFEMSFNGELEAGQNARPYGDGMVGLLFAINLQLPIETTGLYTVEISVQGGVPRRLAFEIELSEPK